MEINKYDIIVVGAGAAGLMAARVAGLRNKSVLLIEHSNKIAEKIRISGGGRCNFTNLYACAENYLSNNPHFVKSALARYSQHDFIKLITEYNIAYHHKTLGQLFCDRSSQEIIEMLVNECNIAGVRTLLNCSVGSITKGEFFKLATNIGVFEADALIIATGGLSIPKMGATDFGYRVAEQFGLRIVPPLPALVPLITQGDQLALCQDLAGIAVPAIVTCQKTSFAENVLFTHRGLSGPAILQISSYLIGTEHEHLSIDLLPGLDILQIMFEQKNTSVLLNNVLKNYLPKRLVDTLGQSILLAKKMTDYKKSELVQIAEKLHNFKLIITGNEGYQKAEVTVGGVDTKELSSKTMEAYNTPGLYFIGEVVDVTGWLGGYNFQWAWSSGYVAGSHA